MIIIDKQNFQEWLKNTRNFKYTELFKKPISFQEMVANQYREYCEMMEIFYESAE